MGLINLMPLWNIVSSKQLFRRQFFKYIYLLPGIKFPALLGAEFTLQTAYSICAKGCVLVILSRSTAP